MSEQDPIVRERTDILDSVGNTTAATGKGFAIASAALTSLALFAAYVTFTGIEGINIFKAPVLSMLFIGGMIPLKQLKMKKIPLSPQIINVLFLILFISLNIPIHYSITQFNYLKTT